MQDGQDIYVCGNPRKYIYKNCRRTFYAYTSAFFKNLIPLIGNTLNKFLKNDTINLKNFSKFFNCSNSYVSVIAKEIMITINNSTEVNIA
ncbi:MAG: hypothetical protein ACTSQO_00600 [Candidatus Helarchaeota archaeon]